jgi:hypothetical protein
VLLRNVQKAFSILYAIFNPHMSLDGNQWCLEMGFWKVSRPGFLESSLTVFSYEEN